MNNQSKKPILAEVDLNDAEKVVLVAFRAGQQHTEDLGEAEIRGDFLCGLFLGHYGEQADYRGGTCIVRAKIPDVLGMGFCETKLPVQFRSCTFAKQINMQQLKCPELDFDGCTLEKGMYAAYAKVGGNVSLRGGFTAKGGVTLAGADVRGQFSCSGGNFQNAEGTALNAQGIKVAQDVFLDDGFTADGRVTLAGADVRGQFSCSGGNFLNPEEDPKENVANLKKGVALVAQNIKVAQGVLLNREFTAKGQVILSGADIGGQFSCSGGNFQNAEGTALNAQGIKVAQDVFLDDGFTADGRVTLAGADVRGQFSCSGGNFLNPEEDPKENVANLKKGVALVAQNIKVAQGVLLNREFTAKGQVILSGADIGGQFSCSGGNFQNAEGTALNAQGIKVAQGVFLDDGFTADGRVTLAGADIGGQFSCSGGNFQNAEGTALNAQGIEVAQDVFLDDGFTADGRVTLAGADVRGQFSCSGGHFQNAGESALDARGIKVAKDVLMVGELTEEGLSKALGEHMKKLGGENLKKIEAEGLEKLTAENLKDLVAEVQKKLADEDSEVLIKAEDVKKHLAEAFKKISASGASRTQDIVPEIQKALANGGFEVPTEDVKKHLAKAEEKFANFQKRLLQGNRSGDIPELEEILTDEEKIVLECQMRLGIDDGPLIMENLTTVERIVFECNQKIAGESLAKNMAEFQKKHDAEVSDSLPDWCWNKFTAKGKVDLSDADVRGNLELKACQLTHLVLAGANVSGTFKDNTKVYKHKNNGAENSSKSGDSIDIALDIDGFRYGRLDVRGEKLKAAEQVKFRLKWVGHMSKVRKGREDNEFYPQPYEQLMKVYREMGHINWVRKVGFVLEQRRHKNFDSKWWKLWYWALRLTVGYGYKPLIIVAFWFLPLIISSGLLFGGSSPRCPDSETGGVVWSCMARSGPTYAQSNQDRGSAYPQSSSVYDKFLFLQGIGRNRETVYPQFNGIYYAVEVAIPVLPLGQVENWHPKNRVAAWIQGGITMIGGLILAILASYGISLIGPGGRSDK